MSIRWLIRADMEQVLAIESAVFPDPWSEKEFMGCLRQMNCIGLVCERDDLVVGFVIYELHRSRLEVLNLAVEPSQQRKGIGSQIIDKLKSRLSSQRRNEIRLDVSERNLGAHLFFKSHGFLATEILRDRFDDGSLAYTMQCKLERRGGLAVRNRVRQFFKESN